MQLFSGKDYLKISIANSFGQDKLNWNNRLEWFNENIEPYVSVDSSNILLKGLAMNAEEPELAFTGLIAYKKYLAGKPSGYRISLDSTASGMQIMAAITGDTWGMAFTNLGDTGQRADGYTLVYQLMQERYKAATGTSLTLTRKDIKAAIMVTLYGGIKSVLESLGNDQIAFNIMNQVLEEYLPRVVALKDELLASIDGSTQYEWYAPDGFQVIAKTFTRSQVEMDNGLKIHLVHEGYDPSYKGNLASFIHTLDGYIAREVISRCNYSKRNILRCKKLLEIEEPFYISIEEPKEIDLFKNNVVSASVFDYLTRDNLHLVQHKREPLLKLADTMLKAEPFDVVVVHDCFTCLPNHGNVLRYWYKEVMAELVESGFVADSITALLPKGSKVIPKDDERTALIAEIIRQSEYAIC